MTNPSLTQNSSILPHAPADLLTIPTWLLRARELSPTVARTHYTANLQGISTPTSYISESESTFTTRWSSILAPDKWMQWSISWLRALDAYGTPANFVEHATFHPDTFSRLGKKWESYGIVNANHAMRRELMSQQRPYTRRFDATMSGVTPEQGCLLCENVAQAIDSTQDPARVSSNLMLDLGTAVVKPNRYPGLPLHSLWLPKRHDNLAARVERTLLPSEDGFENVVALPREYGKTRGNLVNEDELAGLFHCCASVGFIAIRNHPLSGMSIGWHDHWHLQPHEVYPKEYFARIAFDGGEELPSTFRAHGSPFDVLVLQGEDLGDLARRTSEVMNNLERNDVVFSPIFVPGTPSIVMIAPLKSDKVRDRYVQIGGTVQVHGWSRGDAELSDRVRHYVPTKYTFDWSSFVTGASMPTDNEALYSESYPYTPIDYSVATTWGYGAPIQELLTESQRALYQSLTPLQDKRGDLGHVDTVIYFAHRLATILSLSELDKDAVITAAILHDVGWSSVPNVQKVFSDLVTRARSSDTAVSTSAKTEMLEMRIFHQDESVRIAREMIPNHPRLDDICTTIGDHDTRLKMPRPEFRAFWDADMLWRFTLTALRSDSLGEVDRSNPDEVFAVMGGQLTRDSFSLPWAYAIARKELINTILSAEKRLGWKGLPTEFCTIFGAGILLDE